jgi:hypothetical protein
VRDYAGAAAVGEALRSRSGLPQPQIDPSQEIPRPRAATIRGGTPPVDRSLPRAWEQLPTMWTGFGAPVTPYHQVALCHPAVHNVDSSLCHIRGTDWYARFGR